jgi:hypothetical protein
MSRSSKLFFPSGLPNRHLYAPLLCPTNHMPQPFYSPWSLEQQLNLHIFQLVYFQNYEKRQNHLRLTVGSTGLFCNLMMKESAVLHIS